MGNPSHLGPRPPWVGERLDRRYKEHLLCSQIALIEPIGLFPLRDPQHSARCNGVGQVDSRVGKQHLHFAVGAALKDIKGRRTGGSKREMQPGVGGKGGSRCNGVSPVVAWLFGMHCKVEGNISAGLGGNGRIVGFCEGLSSRLVGGGTLELFGELGNAGDAARHVFTAGGVGLAVEDTFVVFVAEALCERDVAFCFLVDLANGLPFSSRRAS